MVLRYCFVLLTGYASHSPGKSCADIMELYPTTADGAFWIRSASSISYRVLLVILIHYRRIANGLVIRFGNSSMLHLILMRLKIERVM